jgi:hypothetical protein
LTCHFFASGLIGKARICAGFLACQNRGID